MDTDAQANRILRLLRRREIQGEPDQIAASAIAEALQVDPLTVRMAVELLEIRRCVYVSDTANGIYMITLTDLGDLNGAIDALKRVVAKKPDWVFALNELGIAYRKQNNYKEAAGYFRKAIDSDGKYVVAYYNLAETEFRAGNLGEAKKAYQKVRQLGRPDLAAKLELMSGGMIKG